MSTENSKNKNIVKTILILILILIVIVCIYFIRRVVIVNKILDKMAKNNEITNIQYDVKQLTYGNDELESKSEIYIKGEQAKSKIDSMNKCVFLNYDGKAYIVNETEKEYMEIPMEGMIYPDKSLSEGVYKEASFMERIKFACNWKIENDEINGEKCYHLTIDDTEFWISKNNYFIIKQKCYDGTIIENFNIKVNDVKDEEMKLPDFTDYSIMK